MRVVGHKFGSLFLLACLLAAPRAGAAQDEAARRRAAVKRLVEVTRMAAGSAQVFDELVTRYQKNWADSVIKDFRARGMFKPYSAADAARIDRLAAEMKARPPVPPERIMAAWRALPPDHFSAEEKVKLFAFAATPAAAKLGEGFPEFIRGVMANLAPHAPRMGQLAAEVFNRHTEEFARRLGELKIAPAQGQPRGRRRPRR